MNDLRQNSKKIKKYDKIFLGTGIISILEAVYQSNKGKSVLMIDKQLDLGGAWKPLSIFGFKNVENAIHYFLPDSKATSFMSTFLGWNIIESKTKRRLIKLTNFGYLSLDYDGYISKILNIFLKAEKSNLAYKLSSLWNISWQHILGNNHTSLYVKGGAPEMIKSIKKLVNRSKVDIKYATEVEKIDIDTEKVLIQTKKGVYECSQIIFTHGSVISNLIYSGGVQFLLEDKIHARPAVHLYVEDNYIAEIKEGIFINDPLIKYVHDVTHMTEQSKRLEGKKIFVFALHPDVKKGHGVYDSILEKLQEARMVGPKSKLIDGIWTDVFLPSLYDSDLISLKGNFKGRVDILKTENFAKGMGYYSDKWQEQLVIKE